MNRGTRRVVLGVGLSSSATARSVEELLDAVLVEAGASWAEVVAVATRERFVDDPRLPTRVAVVGLADDVLRPGGGPGPPPVAEPAALAVAGPGTTLLVAKRRSGGATAALAGRARPAC